MPSGCKQKLFYANLGFSSRYRSLLLLQPWRFPQSKYAVVFTLLTMFLLFYCIATRQNLGKMFCCIIKLAFSVVPAKSKKMQLVYYYLTACIIIHCIILPNCLQHFTFPVKIHYVLFKLRTNQNSTAITLIYDNICECIYCHSFHNNGSHSSYSNLAVNFKHGL